MATYTSGVYQTSDISAANHTHQFTAAGGAAAAPQILEITATCHSTCTVYDGSWFSSYWEPVYQPVTDCSDVPGSNCEGPGGFELSVPGLNESSTCIISNCGGSASVGVLGTDLPHLTGYMDIPYSLEVGGVIPTKLLTAWMYGWRVDDYIRLWGTYAPNQNANGTVYTFQVWV